MRSITLLYTVSGDAGPREVRGQLRFAEFQVRGARRRSDQPSAGRSIEVTVAEQRPAAECRVETEQGERADNPDGHVRRHDRNGCLHVSRGGMIVRTLDDQGVR